MPTTDTGPNLTNLTYVGRQAVKFGAIAIVALIVGRTLFSALYNYWLVLNPPAPPPPTVGFGLLPPIEFPEKDEAAKPKRYVLETANGTTPSFGDRAKVFFMPESSPSLLADQQAKKVAADYGFVFEPEVLGDREYRWNKSQPFDTILEMDIQNLHHTLSTDYLSRPELLAPKELPEGLAAVNRVKGYLSRVDLLPRDVATTAGETTYLKAVGGELEPAVSFSDADFIQVDLNRANIDSKYRMFTPKGYQGVIHAILTGAITGNNAVVYLEYHYQPVDYSQVHTYPLRSTQEAWKLLQAGEGYIAMPAKGDQAVVRDVFLGYFDSFDEQPYLQPIYVFAGDDGFLGYVSALDPKYMQQNALPPN